MAIEVEEEFNQAGLAKLSPERRAAHDKIVATIKAAYEAAEALGEQHGLCVQMEFGVKECSCNPAKHNFLN